VNPKQGRFGEQAKSRFGRSDSLPQWVIVTNMVDCSWPCRHGGYLLPKNS